MRIVLSTIAAFSLICVLASCARGGNVDKGRNGFIGDRHNEGDEIVTTVEDDRNDGIINGNGSDINGNHSNDGISGRMGRGLDGMNPDSLIPEGIRR